MLLILSIAKFNPLAYITIFENQTWQNGTENDWPENELVNFIHHENLKA